MKDYAFVTESSVICKNCYTPTYYANKVEISIAYPDGFTCDECGVVVGVPIIPCPDSDGGYDCTPFCPSCEGNQEVEVTA